jgi:DNA processing protein
MAAPATGGSAAERDAWLVLASVDGIGDEMFGRLLGIFGSASDVLRAALDGRLARASSEWRSRFGRPLVTAPAAAALRLAADEGSSRLERAQELGLWTLTPLDAGYPERLRDLDPPPAALYGLGDPAALTTRRTVAVVGTRRPTPAGRTLAARVCSRLVECGAVVVSGLAVGIDGASHAVVAERGRPTVGVIGAGHDHPGPRAHAALRRDILAAKGAIVSEHRPQIQASRGTYPRRNRVIAALAETTIVIEAPARSGALITARHALELGRQVLVAPGRIGDWSVAGSLALLRDTPARPLIGLDEMMADLGYLGGEGAVAGDGRPAARGSALATLGVTERAVAERLCVGPAGLDALVTDTGLAPSVVSGAVTFLMMRGWAQAMGPAYLPAGPLLG